MQVRRLHLRGRVRRYLRHFFTRTRFTIFITQSKPLRKPILDLVTISLFFEQVVVVLFLKLHEHGMATLLTFIVHLQFLWPKTVIIAIFLFFFQLQPKNLTFLPLLQRIGLAYLMILLTHLNPTRFDRLMARIRYLLRTHFLPEMRSFLHGQR